MKHLPPRRVPSGAKRDKKMYACHNIGDGVYAMGSKLRSSAIQFRLQVLKSDHGKILNGAKCVIVNITDMQYRLEAWLSFWVQSSDLEFRRVI